MTRNHTMSFIYILYVYFLAMSTLTILTSKSMCSKINIMRLHELDIKIYVCRRKGVSGTCILLELRSNNYQMAYPVINVSREERFS